MDPAGGRNVGLTRGIYVTAFGQPARECAGRLLLSLQRFLPEIPVCFCGSERLGGESVFVEQPDSDIGGRGAKLLAYELTPAEWDAVLYLDADTEAISSDLAFYFELIEDGWEFVICKDPMREDVAQLPRQKYDAAELADLERRMGTLHTLMLNGGVWSFGRNEAVRAFFGRWQLEWEKFGRRDQGALLRALYAGPLRMYVLGNEWNYFPAYSSRITAPAALMHYPGRARRWGGQVPGRLDGEVAWSHVQRWEQAQTQRARRSRR
jgi:hypothetical protein